MLPNQDFVQSDDFDEKISLESSHPNETPSSYGACGRQNLDYFSAFIDSCDVGGTSAISKEFRKAWQNLKAGRRWAAAQT